MKLVFAVLLSSLLAFSCTSPKEKVQETFYQNPVIPGDFPDPSIIRVGETYYAAGTTSDFAPNYPLYESTNLVNWKQIGFVFDSQPEWTSINFWAPELYYKDGTYFVYYTAKRKGDNVTCIGVATTSDIHKGFTDQGIIIEWGSEAIDAFVFQDVDQKLYISWKAYGLNPDRPIELLCSELSADGLHLVGDHFTLTDFEKGWNGAGDEGQCLIKHGEYYYLLYSIGGCCDNRCDYRVVVSRSKNLHSGWEQLPEPIMQGGEEWKCTGHGTLVTTPDERYFYLYHSYNATDFEYIGRQGMLDELIWDEQTEWPKFKNGNTPSVKAATPFPNTIQQRDSVTEYPFFEAESLAFWQWDLIPSKPKTEIADGVLSVEATHEGTSFLGLSPKTGNYSLEAGLNPTDDFGGICIYGNQKNVLSLMVKKNELVLCQIKNGEKEILLQSELESEVPVFLKLEATHGRFIQFFWSPDQAEWQPLKINDADQIDGSYLPQWGVAVRVGLIVDGDTGSKANISSVKMTNHF